MSTEGKRKKVTTHTVLAKKRNGEKIAMLTAYDFPLASLLDQAGVDCLLVGDSLAMVVLGYENTLSVTMDDMIYHAKAVARGAKHCLLIGDMPFLSYQLGREETIRNAGRFLSEAGMDAVKLEGGAEQADTVKAIVQCGIPVMGHIGLTPQHVHAFGGYKTQGTDVDGAWTLIESARRLQDAGCFGLVLEKIPSALAKLISEDLEIPTIGIGGGAHCDGQVLVTHDMLGLFEKFRPKFVKTYANLGSTIRESISHYVDEVKGQAFPEEKHSFTMDADAVEELTRRLDRRN